MSDLIKEIITERNRQCGIFVEGFSPERDIREYPRGQLALAAACYAAGPPELFRLGPVLENNMRLPIPIWPWSQRCWKPTTRRRDLIKAAALILAELERIDADGN